MLSKVIDTDGRITIPGFYDAVEEVPQAEREMIAHIPYHRRLRAPKYVRHVFPVRTVGSSTDREARQASRHNERISTLF